MQHLAGYGSSAAHSATSLGALEVKPEVKQAIGKARTTANKGFGCSALLIET